MGPRCPSKTCQAQKTDVLHGVSSALQAFNDKHDDDDSADASDRYRMEN